MEVKEKEQGIVDKDIQVNLVNLDIKVNLAKQDHWEGHIKEMLVNLELILDSQLGTQISQQLTQVNQQLTQVNHLVVLTSSLLPILFNLEAILDRGPCHIQPNLLKGFLVCFTQHMILVQVANPSSLHASHLILPLAQQPHPQQPLSILP